MNSKISSKVRVCGFVLNLGVKRRIILSWQGAFTCTCAEIKIKNWNITVFKKVFYFERSIFMEQKIFLSKFNRISQTWNWKMFMSISQNCVRCNFSLSNLALEKVSSRNNFWLAPCPIPFHATIAPSSSPKSAISKAGRFLVIIDKILKLKIKYF